MNVSRDLIDRCIERTPKLTFRHWYYRHAKPARVDFDQWAAAGGFEFDDEGVVAVKHRGRRCRNPLTIASQAQLCYATAFATDGDEREAAVEMFLIIMARLRELAQAGSIGALWMYDYPAADLKPPWASCLSQATIMDELFKCAELTGDDSARQLAIDAFKPLLVDVNDGGMASCSDDEGAWLQEYPNSRTFRDVLNGFLSSTMIVMNNSPSLGDHLPADLPRQWLESIKRALVRYTTDDEVRYAATGSGGETPRGYFSQMIRQLEEVHRHHDDDPIWLEYANRWRAIAAKQPRSHWWDRIAKKIQR